MRGIFGNPLRNTCYPLVLAAALAAGQVSAHTSAEDASAAPRQCLSAPIETNKVIDQDTLYLKDRSGNAALLTMSGPCLEVGNAIVIKYVGAQEICSRVDADISGVMYGMPPMQCIVKSIKALSKDEAKAYEDMKPGFKSGGG